MPKRIQRKRTKGWKMPSNTVYVGRPSKYSNPFRLDSYNNEYGFSKAILRRWAKDDFEAALLDDRLPYNEQDIINELKGKNLACWCPEKQPCHADILLKIANHGIEQESR